MIYTLISNFNDINANQFSTFFQNINWNHSSITLNNVSALKFISILCENYRNRKLKTGEIGEQDFIYVSDIFNYIVYLNPSQVWELYIPEEYKDNFMRYDYYRKILAGDVTKAINEGVDIISSLLHYNVFFQ